MKTEQNDITNQPRFNVRRSFANRVSIYTALIAGAIFALTVLLSGHELRRTLRTNMGDSAEQQLNYINLEIGAQLAEISRTINAIAPMMQRELERPQVDSASLALYLSQLIEGNRKLRACNLALDPDHPCGHPYLSLYACRDEEGHVRVDQLASETFRYECMDWYIIPKLKGAEYWTDPYISMVGDHAIICTYSLPLMDQEGRCLGVVSADINTSNFTRFLRENSKYSHSYNIMIGEDAHFIVHPDENNILSHTIFSLHVDDPDTAWAHIGHEMMAAHLGHEVVRDQGETYHVFYAPIRDINWSMAIVYAEQDFYAASRHQMTRMLIYSLLATVLLFFVARFMVRRIARPLVSMAGAAREVAGGNFDAPLPEITTHDELRELHDSLELMQGSLSTFMGQIQHNAAVQQRIESELDMARNVQLGMLPQFDSAMLDDPRFDLAAYLRPALTVGGDLYDFYLVDNYLYTVVADVSGKGFPASLLMVEARSMLRLVVRTEAEPARILSYVNTSILETNKANMFITMFIGRLDLNTGQYVYSNAGHNPPLLLRNDGTVEEILSDPNLPLGSIDGIAYEESSLQLQPGEMVYIYTDGVSEAENLQHELFGTENIMRMLAQCDYLDCRRTIDAIDREMSCHVGTAPQADDITALCFRYHTPDRCPRPIATTVSLRVVEDIPLLYEALEKLGAQHHIPEETILSLNLAVEEAAVNVIHYAFPYKTTPPSFDVHLRCDGNEVDIIIDDTGIPFDPTQAPEVDTDLPLEERTIGGLGIHLVRQIMDSMTYTRFNNHNILRLKKKIV